MLDRGCNLPVVAALPPPVEDVRIVLEPRARTVDAELLEESLYRLTDLEVRFPLNLNVLDENRTPVVMTDRRYWRRQRLIGGSTFLADVARQVGRDRFLEFLNSPLSVDSALSRALSDAK